MRTTTSPDPTSALPTRGTALRGWLLPTVLLLVLLTLAAGLLLGRGTAATADVTDEVSVGFLQDMKVHHAQAVRMSEIVHRRSSDPGLNYLAFDILSTQQGQIGIMTGWLDLSGRSQSAAAPTMAWMGHEGPMPGMATDEQVAELDVLPVPQMEEQYLRLMLEHHRGALPMAQYAAEHADSDQVEDLAQGMYDGQAAEIELMQDMLAARGAAPAAAEEPSEHTDH
jgi:uncharacterized protein (DUF305 family)